MNKKTLREMANFLIKIDYRKSPFYKNPPQFQIRTSGYALEQYLWFWANNPPIWPILHFLGIETKGKKLKQFGDIKNNKMILTENIWQWCFSPEWEKIAQTKGELKLTECTNPKEKLKDAVILTLAERETGQRILWLLDYGLPKNWKAQMEGKEERDCLGLYGLNWKNIDFKQLLLDPKPSDTQAHTDN